MQEVLEKYTFVLKHELVITTDNGEISKVPIDEPLVFTHSTIRGSKYPISCNSPVLINEVLERCKCEMINRLAEKEGLNKC